MWQIVGHTRAVSLLERSLQKEALAHAYLFVGPSQVGKMTLAVNLAQALNCETDEPPCGECNSCQKIASAKHVDVQIIGLDDTGKSGLDKARVEISIDQVREMQHAASLPPFEGRRKVFIFDGAERLSVEAANCLLKTLEEPVGGVVFILLASDDRLLPVTVVSRCQRLELAPLSAAMMEEAMLSRGIDKELAKLLARLAHGRLGWALSAAYDSGLLQQRTEKLERLLDVMVDDHEERFAYATQLAAQFSKNRDTVQGILDQWLDWWRDLMLVKVGCHEAVTNIDMADTFEELVGHYSLEQIRNFIDRLQAAKGQLGQNANPRLVLEVLMLNIPEKING